ncbi:MAG: imidazolonepropionase [Clostridia bacterium]|nr:imidazolonepropionase [Clostridia bacterium]
MKQVFFNIGELKTATGSVAVSGKAQGELLTLHNAWLLEEDGLIASLGTGKPPKADKTVDCRGKLVTAGLVDCHTHLVFGGWRENELAMKLAGKSYLEILAAGGGILSTVRETRRASEDELYEKTRGLFLEMLVYGTTAVEIKSGYGLNLETEKKQLRVVRRMKEEFGDVKATFLGAHAFPEGMTHEAYVNWLCEEAIPAIAEEGLADFCDAFCDEGVFSAEQSERILNAGKRYGLIPKLHADEIKEIGGTEIAARVGAVSCDHLSETGEEGIKALRDGGVIAVMLPATSFYLKKPYGDFRGMIDAGVPVAVATDMNPGSTPNLSLPFAMTAGCLYGRLTPSEMLTAATVNGAAAIGMAERIGTLEPGKQADLVVWDTENLDRLIYRYGTNRAVAVFKRGVRMTGKENLWNV